MNRFMQRTAGVAALVGLATATVLTTSKIIGQQVVKRRLPAQTAGVDAVPRPRAQPEPRVISHEDAIELIQARRQAAAAETMLPDRCPAAFVKQSYEVKAAGRRVRILLTAKTGDRDPRNRYVWSLVIRTKDGDLVSEKDYAKQTFVHPDRTFLYPTFAEEITLPPGEYEVEVSLSSAEPGFDITRVRREDIDEDGRWGRRELKAARMITVAD